MMPPNPAHGFGWNWILDSAGLKLMTLGIKAMTGGLVDIPFLPDFPIETWNFRIAHVAGALILGFLMFSAT